MEDPTTGDFHRRLKAVEDKLRSNPAPTIPSLDSTNFPQDAVYGQIVKDINDHSMWVYGEDDDWHPVGGSGGVSNEFLNATGGGNVSAGGAQTYFSLAPGGQRTNAPGTYGLALGSGALSTKYGFIVKQEGVYKVQWTFVFGLATNNHRLQGYYVGDVGFRSSWLFGWQEILFDATASADTQRRQISFAELMYVGGPDWIGPLTFPRGPEIPWAQDVDGSSFSVTIDVVVERIGTSYVDI